MRRFSSFATHFSLGFAIFLFCVSPAAAQEKPDAVMLKKSQDAYAKNDLNLAIVYATAAISMNPSNFLGYFIRGVVYIKNGSYDKAIDDYTKVTELASNFADGYTNRAIAYGAKGFTALALKDYSSAISYDAKNETALSGRGTIYFNQKNYDGAIQDFSVAITISAKNTDYYFYRATACYYKALYDLAISDFDSVLSKSPDYTNAYFNRALCYNQKGLKKNALADYTEAIRTNPKYAAAYQNRGSVYFDLQNTGLALADFAEALRLDPTSSDAYLARGNVWYGLKKYDQAIADYTEAVRLHPASYYAVYNKGLAYYFSKNYDQAIQNFTAALAITPTSFDAYFYRGYANSDAKNFDKAAADFTESLKIKPQDVNTYVIRGVCYQNNADYDKAVADYSSAIMISPKDTTVAAAYINRGNIYSFKGNFQSAIADFSTAIQLDPANKDAYTGRGSTYFFNSLPDKAVLDFSELIRLDSSLTSGYHDRANAYMLLGDYQKAIADYKQAILVDANQGDSYIDLLTAYTHTGEMDKAVPYYEAFKSKNLKRPVQNKGWEFYDHYITALLDGVFTRSYSKALDELNTAQQNYIPPASANPAENETKFGLVDVLFLKGFILEQLGDFDKSKNAYQQALVINTNQADVKEAIARLDKQNQVAITQDHTAPTIKIISPEASRSIDIVTDAGEKQVIGIAQDAVGIQSVKINGKPASTLEDNGTFIYYMPFTEGDNVLNIEATDKNGNTATKSFTFSGNKAAQVSNKKESETLNISNTPVYHAILIAEQNYTDPNIPTLSHPVGDARDLKDVLINNYTFNESNVQLLENKSKEEILSVITSKANTIDTNENLLIFYAGHGTVQKDKDGNVVDGFMIPVDAVRNNYRTYIRTGDLQFALKTSNAKHILLISDACYSGSITRDLGDDNAPKDITMQYKYKSRKAMTSGNLEPVKDISVFLEYLRSNLRSNSAKYFSANDLFNSFAKAVMKETENLPIYAPIPNVGNLGGDFIFIRK